MKLLQQDGSDCVGDVNYLDELNIHHKSKRRRTAATAAPVPAAADVLDADSSGAQGDRDSEDDNCNETPSDDCDDDAVGDDDERELLSALEEDKEPLSDEDAAFFQVSSSSTTPQHQHTISSASSVFLWALTPPTPSADCHHAACLQDKLLSAQRSSSGARQIRSPSAAAAHNQFQQSHDVNGSAQLYQLYVCGSHRPDNCWPHDLKMSAGSYCRLPSIRAVTHEALLELLHFSVLLHGGTPDCTRAELGAIWQGLRRLLAAVESGELDPDCSMVEVFTTCESAVDMLTKDVRIAEQYAALITGGWLSYRCMMLCGIGWENSFSSK